MITKFLNAFLMLIKFFGFGFLSFFIKNTMFSYFVLILVAYALKYCVKNRNYIINMV